MCVRRIPKVVRELMKSKEWPGRVFAGGGFIRSIVAGDEVNDIDLFTDSKESAHVLMGNLRALFLEARVNTRLHETDNAYTIIGPEPTIQIIHRWKFTNPVELVESFDFTCCGAAVYFDGVHWQSVCLDTFYEDVAAKRLVYRAPVREEAPGGSLLRVLKYYQKGYRIPLDSLAKVISRLVGSKAISLSSIQERLFEVDPQEDPEHIFHLPPQHATLDPEL